MMTEQIEVTSDATEAEQRRLSHRAAAKKQLADIAERFEQIEDKRAAIALLDRKSDIAADEHQAKCRPIQAELASLAGNPEQATRRRELHAEIAAANAELEHAIELNKKSQEGIRQEIRQLEHGCREKTVIQNQLCGDLADPKLQDEHHLAIDRLKWAQHRLEHAQAKYGQVAEFQRIAKTTGDFGGPSAYRRQVHQWTVVLADARQHVTDCKHRVDEIRKQMMSE